MLQNTTGGGVRALAGGLLAVGLMVIPAAAETLQERTEAAGQIVRQALASEAVGYDAGRAALMQSALEKRPGFAPALWQAGHVRVHNQWMKYDEVPDALARERRLVAYRQIRDDYADTVEGRIVLARWCADQGLTDQARAHLTEVLDLQPDNPVARGLLGYQLIDGSWLTAEEIQQRRARQQIRREAIAKWWPAFQKIRAGLDHRLPTRQALAEEELLAITDPDVIPAIEELMLQRNEGLARLAVTAIARIDSHEAARTLALQAVFSEWNTVRMAAAEGLKSQKPHDYMPLLLSGLSAPITARTEYYRAPSGRVDYVLTYSRERQYDRQVAQMGVQRGGRPRRQFGGMFSGNSDAAPPETSGAMTVMQSAVAEQNAGIADRNLRISTVLRTATGQEELATPDEWWSWWDEHNEAFLAGEKQVQTIRMVGPKYLARLEPRLPGILPSIQRADPEALSQFMPPVRHECLAAGTPVWTTTGQTPVERVEVGDHVLSKDVETGRLEFKTVLRTTVRPPEELIAVETGTDILKTSGGHPFWVSGRGWLKARDLEADMCLHTVEGTVVVRSVGPAAEEETYNLVVADFHTYFAGEQLILTHDNTNRRPTDAVVPGFSSR